MPKTKPIKIASTRRVKIARYFCLIACLLAILAPGRSCLAQCHDNAVDIETDQGASNGVRFFVTSRRTIEASVILKCDFLQNLTSSRALPLTFLVDREYKKYEILRFTQTDQRQPWHWGNYEYHFVMGAPSRLPTTDFVYCLPYPKSTHCRIGQSYFGTYSHQAGTPDEYAIDMTMPEGTPVLAARGGTVIAYRDDSNSGGPSEQYKECCNYINVKHDDGTYAAYVHLRYKGVAVKLGQVVAAGTLLGYSGQTGWVSNPHLHFMVYRVLPPAVLKTIPFRTRTADGVVPQLLEGQTY
jgi:murein DD-endopeptidase MepM/ murein hydrolase activator NlpD